MYNLYFGLQCILRLRRPCMNLKIITNWPQGFLFSFTQLMELSTAVSKKKKILI